MLGMLLISSHEVVQIEKDNVNEVVEVKGHGSLKSGSIIFKSKRHDTLWKSAPGGGKGGFILILFVDMDFVLTQKTVHEGKYFMASTCIDDLVDKRSGEVVFGTSQIQITEVSTHTNGSLLFINGNMIGNPSGIRDGVYETCFT